MDAVGDLYVTDFDNNRVLELAAGSANSRVLPFAGLSAPDGVAVDAAGDLYVTDQGNNRVLKLAAGSNTPTVLPFTGLDHATGAAWTAPAISTSPTGATTGCSSCRPDRIPKSSCRSLGTSIPVVWRWMPPATSTSPIMPTTAVQTAGGVMRRTGGRKGLQGQCARGNVKDQMLCDTDLFLSARSTSRAPQPTPRREPDGGKRPISSAVPCWSFTQTVPTRWPRRLNNRNSRPTWSSLRPNNADLAGRPSHQLDPLTGRPNRSAYRHRRRGSPKSPSLSPPGL